MHNSWSLTRRIITLFSLACLLTLSFTVILAPSSAQESSAFALRKRAGGEPAAGGIPPSVSSSPAASSTSTTTSVTTSSSTSQKPVSSSTSSSTTTKLFVSTTTTSTTKTTSSVAPSTTSTTTSSTTTSTTATSTSSTSSTITSSSSTSAVPNTITATLPLGTQASLPAGTTLQVTGSKISLPSDPTDTTTAIPSSAAVSNGFWSNKGAVAATFTIISLVIVGLLGAVILLRRRSSNRGNNDDMLFEKYGDETANGGVVAADDISAHEYVTQAPMDSYPDRRIHYGNERTAEMYTPPQQQQQMNMYAPQGHSKVVSRGQNQQQAARSTNVPPVEDDYAGHDDIYAQYDYVAEGQAHAIEYAPGTAYSTETDHDAAYQGYENYSAYTQPAEESLPRHDATSPTPHPYSHPANASSVGLAPPVVFNRDTPGRGSYQQSIDSFYGNTSPSSSR